MQLLKLLALIALVAAAAIRLPRGLYIDATEPAGRLQRVLYRISYLMLIIPLSVIVSVCLLIFWRIYGGPGLLAFKQYFQFAGHLWIASSISGIVCALGASMPIRRSANGFALAATHACLLFLVWIAPYFQYVGHPD